MPRTRRVILFIRLTAAFALPCLSAIAADPWIISSDVVITEPIDVDDIIVIGDGSLTVRDLPEPGLRVTGNIWALGDASIRLENSIIQFMSVYHGQFALAGIDNTTLEVIGCDYRVPNQVQHALVVGGDAVLVVEDTDFGDVQLISSGDARLVARRLNGNFEVLVQDDSTIELADIPREPDEGRIWVWVEFPSGSVAEYTPPMPGFVSFWTFPPPDAVGISQSVVVERCEVKLWPMLVREDCRLTLRDIPESNWVVVGLYLPDSVTIANLANGQTHASTDLVFSQELHLVNASIDTWNLYPQLDARVRVRDSVLGEILSFGHSRVRVEKTTIDGSGGFLGARDHSEIVLSDSRVTCTIEAAHESTIELHDSMVDPYPQDPTGSFTRFGAYDRARLFADQTPVNTTPALGGDGVIGVTFVVNPPDIPPATPTSLVGSVGLFSLGGGPVLEDWRLEAIPRRAGHSVLIAEGDSSVDASEIAVWSDADPGVDQLLRTVLHDSWGRALVGRVWVLGNGPRAQGGGGRRLP
jgi:hypothetical protein